MTNSIHIICKASVPSVIRNFLLLFLLISIPLDTLAEELPSVPLTAEETALWQDHGFSAKVGGEWQYYGINPAEAREWLAAGIEYPGWANQWKSEGFRAGEVGRWKDLTNVYTAAGFLKAGFGPDEAKIWLDSGVQSSLRATEYRDLGMDAATGAAYWRLGIYPEEAGPWFKAGFGPEETLAWRWGPKDIAFYHTNETPYSQEVYRLEAAVEWRQAGFSAEQAHRLSSYQLELAEARAWLDRGFAADEIMTWRDSGFSPAEADALREDGFTLAQAEAHRFEQEWASGDEITDLHYDLNLLTDGRLEVLISLTLINRAGGAYAEGFSLLLPRETELLYGRSHYRSAAPSYRINSVEVDGREADYLYENDRLTISLPADGTARKLRIAYRTDDCLLYFPHHDELSFAPLRDIPEVVIHRAILSVNLPPGADVVFTDGVAGLPGRQDIHTRVEEGTAGKRVVFEASRVLHRKMGMRINVAFTKGNVKPGWFGRFTYLDRRSGRTLTGGLIFLVSLILSTGYFLKVWSKYGRDPQEGVVQKKTGVPETFTPAEARQFMTCGKVDGVSLLATIIHLAQKGALKIIEIDGGYTLIQEPTGTPKVFPAEAAFLAGLFAVGRELPLSGRPARRQLQEGIRAMRGVLKETFGNYYRANLKYLLPVAVVSALGVVAGVYALKMDDFGEMESFRIIFAVTLSIVALGQLILFKHLLKAPTEGFSRQRDYLRGYRNYLETDMQLGKDLAGYLTPNQTGHLAFSLALGLNLERMAIRPGQARWFSSKSGPFVVGDFAAALRILGRNFRS